MKNDLTETTGTAPFINIDTVHSKLRSNDNLQKYRLSTEGNYIINTKL